MRVYAKLGSKSDSPNGETEISGGRTNNTSKLAVIRLCSSTLDSRLYYNTVIINHDDDKLCVNGLNESGSSSTSCMSQVRVQKQSKKFELWQRRLSLEEKKLELNITQKRKERELKREKWSTKISVFLA